MDAGFHPFQGKVEDWHWWYRTRREILSTLLAKLPLDREKSLILDVGCGTGGSSLVLSEFGRAVGIDAKHSSFAISMDRPYAHRVVGSGEVLPFGDDKFDVVAALDVLEHLDDDVAAATEIRRVIKPGGTAVIFVPAFSILWGYNDDFSHHRRRYTKETLRRVLTAAGLRIETIGYFNMLLFFPLLAARLAERVAPARMRKLEYRDSPSLFNELLAKTFRLELPVLRRSPLPLGSSVYCVAHKDA